MPIFAHFYPKLRFYEIFIFFNFDFWLQNDLKLLKNIEFFNFKPKTSRMIVFCDKMLKFWKI